MKMDAITTLRADIRPTYMMLLKELASTRSKKVEVIGLIAKGMAKVKNFKETADEKQKSIEKLDLVSRALQLVQVILDESKEFWEDQVKFIQKNLIEETTRLLPETALYQSGQLDMRLSLTKVITPEQSRVRRQMDVDAVFSFREGVHQDQDIAKTGLNWLIFAKMGVFGYERLQSVKQAVVKGLLQKLGPAERERILKNADKTITSIQRLHEKLKEQDEINQAEREKSYDLVKKSYQGKLTQDEIKKLGNMLEQEAKQNAETSSQGAQALSLDRLWNVYEQMDWLNEETKENSNNAK